MYQWRDFSVTTSILQPKRFSKSISRLLRSRRDLPFSKFTRKSISLPGVVSFRATDPKTRISIAPCFLAIFRISFFFDLKDQMDLLKQCSYEIIFLNSRVKSYNAILNKCNLFSSLYTKHSLSVNVF